MAEENTPEEEVNLSPEEEQIAVPGEDITSEPEADFTEDMYADPNADLYGEEERAWEDYEEKSKNGLDASPLTLRDCLLMAVLFMIPCVNLIVALVWAFGGSKNINRRNYSRATLIVWAVVFVIYIIFVVAILGGTYRAITG